MFEQCAACAVRAAAPISRAQRQRGGGRDLHVGVVAVVRQPEQPAFLMRQAAERRMQPGARLRLRQQIGRAGLVARRVGRLGLAPVGGATGAGAAGRVRACARSSAARPSRCRARRRSARHRARPGRTRRPARRPARHRAGCAAPACARARCWRRRSLERLRVAGQHCAAAAAPGARRARGVADRRRAAGASAAALAASGMARWHAGRRAKAATIPEALPVACPRPTGGERVRRSGACAARVNGECPGLRCIGTCRFAELRTNAQLCARRCRTPVQAGPRFANLYP